MLNDYRIIEVSGKNSRTTGRWSDYQIVYVVHKDYIPMIEEFLAHWEDYWNGIKGRGEPYEFSFNIEDYVDVSNPPQYIDYPLEQLLTSICEDIGGMTIRTSGGEAYGFEY